MLFQFVVPPPIQPRPQLPASVRGGLFDSLDLGIVVAIGGSLFAHTALMCVAMIPDWPKPTLDEILAGDFSPVQIQVVNTEEVKAPEEDKSDEGDRPAETGQGDQSAAEAAAAADAAAAAAAAAAETKQGPQRTGPAPERVTIGGQSISQRQFGELQAKIENTLSLENILGGGSGGPEMGISEQFGGASAAVTGLADALAGAVGTSDGGGGAGGSYTTVAGNLVNGPSVGSVGGGGTAPVGPVVVPNRVEATQVEKQEVKKGKVRTSGGTPAGGTGSMRGSVFASKLQGKRGAIEACYNNALVRDPTLAGDLTFIIVINQQGSVNVDVERNESSLDAAGVTSCIVGKLRTMNFSASPPTGGDFRVRLPVSFIAP